MNLDLEKFEYAQARACLSVNELADKSGLGRATVSKIIKGAVTPSIKSLGLLARAVNVDIEQLVVTKNK